MCGNVDARHKHLQQPPPRQTAAGTHSAYCLLIDRRRAVKAMARSTGMPWWPCSTGRQASGPRQPDRERGARQKDGSALQPAAVQIKQTLRAYLCGPRSCVADYSPLRGGPAPFIAHGWPSSGGARLAATAWSAGGPTSAPAAAAHPQAIGLGGLNERSAPAVCAGVLVALDNIQHSSILAARSLQNGRLNEISGAPAPLEDRKSVV